MQATGLENDRLVQARGRHLMVSTLVLTLVWWSGNVFALPLATLSLFAIVPALIGLMIGQRGSARMVVARFRLWLFVVTADGLHLGWLNLV